MRDVLAKEMSKVFPELKKEIESVVESTGGNASKVFEGVEVEDGKVAQG